MINLFKHLKSRLSDPFLRRLLILLTIAALSIISINFLTIKVLSSVRAYLQGESLYSKGEKDAAQNLILLLNTRDENYWSAFVQNIKIPQGDSLARVKLLADASKKEIEYGFLQGRNHPDDVDNMIWLFKNFNQYRFMNEPIKIWKSGDSLIHEKYKIGTRVKNMIDDGRMDLAEQNQLLKEILDNSTELTKKESAFSESLGHTSRRIGAYLLYFNLVTTLLIFLAVKIYATYILSKLKERNIALSNANIELDKFVYSASHDLRAPISSLKGLVSISKLEKDETKIQLYLEMMGHTLDKQDQFIKDIIDYSLNKKQELKLEPVNIANLINEAIEEHLYMPGAKDIKITQTLEVTEIQSDQKRLSIILNNLISNAFKYQDHSKNEKSLIIKSTRLNHQAVIELEDNGIGIPPKHLQHIFDMFYVVNTGSKGSGLGLYITRETIHKLGGEIFVSSRINFGTKFTIRLPQPR